MYDAPAFTLTRLNVTEIYSTPLDLVNAIEILLKLTIGDVKNSTLAKITLF